MSFYGSEAPQVRRGKRGGMSAAVAALAVLASIRPCCRQVAYLTWLDQFLLMCFITMSAVFIFAGSSSEKAVSRRLSSKRRQSSAMRFTARLLPAFGVGQHHWRGRVLRVLDLRKPLDVLPGMPSQLC